MTDILIKCFVLYMFSVLFYNLIPFSATLVIGLFIVLILFVKIIQMVTIKWVLLLFYLAFVLLYTSFVTDNLTGNFSDFVRILTVFLLICCMSDLNISNHIIVALTNNKKIIRRASQIGSLITIVMLIMPSCYAVEASWGESNRYFLGFAPSLHVTASCMCLCMAMYLFSLQGRKFETKEIFFFLPPIVAILQSGARIYLICAAGILFLYYYSKNKNRKIKYVLIPLAIIIGGYILLNSNIMDKFLFTQEGYAPSDFNTIDRFTSGRTVFWMRDVIAFNNSNVIEKLFGHGFTYILSVSGHTGHNDVLHMLLGVGVIGCILYVGVFINAISFSLIKLKRKGFSKPFVAIVGMGLVLYIFSPMILNGLFGYQHLLYSIAIILAYVQCLEHN